MNDNLKTKLTTMPESPGCYIWKDQNNDILYIGKAKNLKKRTNQYFINSHNGKTQKLVSLIYDVDYIIVDNENESLILENNLIKKYKPKYNILLKEGSNNYPYIVLTKEKHPRLIYTKNKNIAGHYFGPFANSGEFHAYDFYKLLNQLFPLRKCRTIPKKECMYYHLGQCLGPCINKVEEKQYEEIENKIINIFNHHTSDLMEYFNKKEKEYANNLEFEKAKIYYDYANQLKKITNSKVVELNKIFDVDIIGYYVEKNWLSIMIFNYINGKLLAKHEYVSEIFDDDINEIISSYLFQYYQENNKPKFIYLKLNDDNVKLLEKEFNFKMVEPQKGLYLDLITNAINNAKEYLFKYKLKKDEDYNRSTGALNELEKLIGLKNITTIDLIDNSNTFLEDCVSAIIRFRNAKPSKKEYRKYNLRTQINKSDYYFMQEVIIRKYTKEEIPDLLIVDGGKLQVNAAIEIFKQLELDSKPMIIGLQKNKKHQTDKIITEDGNEIEIDKHSYLFRFLSYMQDEVHRFVINFHRNKSSKSKMSSFLDDIEFLGEKSKQKILKIYPNLYDLKNVDLQTIEQIVNKKAARNLYEKINKELKK